jgi:hypothetical protein
MTKLKRSLEATRKFDAMVKEFKTSGETDGRKCHGLYLRGMKIFENAGLERNAAIRMTVDLCKKNGQKIG